MSITKPPADFKGFPAEPRDYEINKINEILANPNDILFNKPNSDVPAIYMSLSPIRDFDRFLVFNENGVAMLHAHSMAYTNEGDFYKGFSYNGRNDDFTPEKAYIPHETTQKNVLQRLDLMKKYAPSILAKANDKPADIDLGVNRHWLNAYTVSEQQAFETIKRTTEDLLMQLYRAAGNITSMDYGYHNPELGKQLMKIKIENIEDLGNFINKGTHYALQAAREHRNEYNKQNRKRDEEYKKKVARMGKPAKPTRYNPPAPQNIEKGR